MATDRGLVIDASHYLKGEYKGELSLDFKNYLDDWAAMQEVPFTPSFWATHTLELIDSEDKCVFTDVRLPTEYEPLKKLGCVFVGLYCSRETCESRLSLRDGGIQPGIWDSQFEKHWQTFEYDIILNAEKHIDNVYESFVREFNKVMRKNDQ
jgi:dephospho-CoA kinase